jgi:hypothetical protein
MKHTETDEHYHKNMLFVKLSENNVWVSEMIQNFLLIACLFTQFYNEPWNSHIQL